jgi:hypothetical protein
MKHSSVAGISARHVETPYCERDEALATRLGIKIDSPFATMPPP